MQTTRRTPLRPDRRLIWGLTALIGLSIDQVAKTAALARLDPDAPISLLGGLLTLQLAWNDGAAFSLGGGGNLTWLFTTFAVLVFCGVTWFVLRRLRHRGWGLVLGLLTAGVLGNLADRLFRPPGPGVGHVVDYLQLPKWPIFNVADIFVTSAAIGIIWLSVIKNVSPYATLEASPQVEQESDRREPESGAQEGLAQEPEHTGSTPRDDRDHDEVGNDDTRTSNRSTPQKAAE
ncbi:MAG: signal peptidase II [Propionibacteriales bacterium]|nr:signal peptidase II [Propionibacteriales bacterium]